MAVHRLELIPAEGGLIFDRNVLYDPTTTTLVIMWYLSAPA